MKNKIYYGLAVYNKKEIMKKIVRLTERDLSRIVKRVILEMEGEVLECRLS